MRFMVPSVLVAFFFAIALAVFASGAYWDTFERKAEQPIDFPHDIHAGKLNIECNYCHVYADKSKQAGAPAVQICMSCHELAPSQSAEVDKLKKYWEDKQPIKWVRIHKLKAHVYFSHKRHVKAGVECEECHGDMKVVKTVKQVRSFQMGFCVSCHRAKQAPLQCSTCHQ